uniref:Dynamin N-terminal domain-containing protein n=1 Tax=Populus alba TaxID=43335 RepID=A0A4U5R2U2_POPAL|nr:hypothetical protein D5086_0000008790 [Populus alba]
MQKATPLMGELSLLIDAVSQIDEPFLLSIVVNMPFILSKDPFLVLISPQPCPLSRHPDGQYICYLPVQILKELNIVDTPGTNVILQRQQRFTEEFVPHGVLLLFVISADKPLTESEVAFLHYIQQWKKKVIFMLNKSDLYQNSSELEEAILFIKENTRKLLNTDDMILYPISARSALEVRNVNNPQPQQVTHTNNSRSLSAAAHLPVSSSPRHRQIGHLAAATTPCHKKPTEPHRAAVSTVPQCRHSRPWRRLNSSINISIVTPRCQQQQEGNSAKRIEVQKTVEPPLNRTLQQQHQPQPPHLFFQPWRRLNSSINISIVTPRCQQQQEGNSAKRIEAQKTVEVKLITVSRHQQHQPSGSMSSTTSAVRSHISPVIYATSATTPGHRLLPRQLSHNLRSIRDQFHS